MLINVTEDDITSCLSRMVHQQEDPISFVLRTQQDIYHDFVVSCHDIYIWHNDQQYIIPLPKVASLFLSQFINHEDDKLKPICFKIKLPHES
jgi:hypothetical protein